jgi:hypothetical protein
VERNQAGGKEKEAADKALLRAFCQSLLPANPITLRLASGNQANSTHQRTAAMTTHDQIFSPDAFAAGKPARSLASWIKSIVGRIATWADTCADYYAAAAMYQQLSALSDAELTRRGLFRATLAHDVRATCDRGFEH